MSSLIYDFFKKKESTEDMLGTNSETYHFLKDLCAKLDYRGNIDSYYFVKEENNGYIMICLSEVKQDPYDEENETEENYEVELSDFEVVKVGEDKLSETVEYYRNHKYQDFMKQRFASESQKLQESYESGCNSFNGMRYREQAPKADPVVKDPNQTTLDVDETFDEIFEESFDEQGNNGRTS